VAPDEAQLRYRQLMSAREAVLAEMLRVDASPTAALHQRRRRVHLATLHREIDEEMQRLIPLWQPAAAS
jgi:hypothetical protein